MSRGFEPFGGLFDFNGDGTTDAIETALGFSILDEMERQELGRVNSAQAIELRAQLDELVEQKDELESAEPLDSFGLAHQRWERKLSELEERIAELDEEIADLEIG